VEEWLGDERFAWRALCLRLAIIKCHSRQEVDLQAWRLQPQGGRAVLAAAAGWAESRPRTCYLLHEEAKAWSRVGSIGLELAGVPEP
jgi:exopolyphosphatase/guanosine-5'-triphosphate,3'-diphosphate pyrophosphatase